MKILYIGYYKEKSDWGQISKNYALALDSSGLDVACRPITFVDNPTPQELSKLEKKSIEDCDICIQHVFPNHMLASSKFKKNIGILTNDFYEINHSCFIEKLNTMDQIWVPSVLAKKILDNTILKNKTIVVPIPFENEAYRKSFPALDGGIETRDKFRFYTIAENDGDNLDRVIACFHSEFDHTDDAVLIINVNQSASKIVDQRISKVKISLGLHQLPQNYKKDLISNISSEDVMNIHTFCDCYISNLTQRSLNVNEFNAMAFGNTPIISKLNDSVDYFSDKYAVDSIYMVNRDKSQMWPDLTNGKNYSIEMCQYQIKKIMRELYDEWRENPMQYKMNKKKEAFDRIKAFSLQHLGREMKEILNA